MADQAPQGGLRIPQWLAATITGTLLTSIVAMVAMVAVNSDKNGKQDEKLDQIEHRQEIARAIVDRVDAADRELHAELTKLRERVARLERDGGP